jgi:lysophospholipase L1-like esterase
LHLPPVACGDAPQQGTFCQCGARPTPPPRAVVVTIGDSTMANASTPFERGWGDVIPARAARPADVHNQGSSGASSLDFASRAVWPAARALLRPGVFLLIQFGHNDASSDPARHTEPGSAPAYLGTYRDRLLYYINTARAAGATPVLITSVGTMTFDRAGRTTTTLASYLAAVHRLADDEHLILLDLNRASRAEYERLGQAATVAMYSYDDLTHFSPAGARRIAELVIRLACVESETLCAQFDVP